jgi:hypothetical protein
VAEGKIKNRRRGPDILIKTINGIAIISWIVIFGIFITFSLAKPSTWRGVGLSGGGMAGSYNPGYLQFSFYLMVMQLLLCAMGLAINANRLRRKTDGLNKSLIFFGFVSLLGIIIYIILV